MEAAIARRQALDRYWRAMTARPSFAAADIWTRLHLGHFIRGIPRGATKGVSTLGLPMMASERRGRAQNAGGRSSTPSGLQALAQP